MIAGAGTTPPGAQDQRQAAAWVQSMFAGIAPRYDFINHLLSFNIDRQWRKILMQRLLPVLETAHATVLDLCCGTGDVMIDFQRVSKAQIVGADFCHPMLVAAKNKNRERGFPGLLIEGDALQLPIADKALDAVAISFGFRNLASYSNGLQELHRVLKPGGVLAILEFSHPPGVLTKAAYGLYSKILMPAVGAAVSGSREAYAYLPDSIRKFPPAPELRKMMEQSGFAEVDFEFLTGGIAALHLGKKSTVVTAA